MIWDVRTFGCLQTILCKQYKPCKGLLIIDRFKFWTCTNRFIAFKAVQKATNEQIDSDDPTKNDIMSAFYNQYNKTFCIVENLDLRVFSSTKGQSVSLVKNLPKDSSENLTIKCLRHDKRSRKGYMATSSGALKVINIQNGVELCEIETDMNLKQAGQPGTQLALNDDSSEGDDESQNSVDSKKPEKPPVNDLQLVWNDAVYQIIACSG